MSIQDRTFEFLENLKRISNNTFLTDGHKSKTDLQLKLTSVKPESYYIEILDEEDYNEIISYLISEINNPNFVFTKDPFDFKKKYLFWIV